MATKLPEPIMKEELDKILTKLKEEREKRRGVRSQRLSARGKKIHEYYLAVILAAHAGLRISEILGLRAEVSKCCKAGFEVINKRNANGNKIKIKKCLACGKEWNAKDVYRSKTDWDIEPLNQEDFKNDRIFLKNAKGEKDRWVWRPRLILQKDMSYFPLSIKRRGTQYYFTKLTKDLLKKPYNFHSLRHTFATEYLKKYPGDIKTLQILMGHSRLETTGIYTHVSIDDALQRVKEVF